MAPVFDKEKKSGSLQGLRIEGTLYERIKDLSDREGISIAAKVRSLIVKGLEAEKTQPALLTRLNDLEGLAERLSHLEERADRCMPNVMRRLDEVEEQLQFLTVLKERPRKVRSAKARGQPRDNKATQGA